ncbi:unnamed protein product [Cunninghamella echinulata]
MTNKVNTLNLYTIREATEADLEAILGIYNERVLHSTSLFVYDPIDLENRQTWFKDSKSKGYPVIVAVEKSTNQTIAYASLGPYRPHPAYVLAAEVSLYIHENHHRRGLGRILLDELIDIAKKMKLRSLIGKAYRVKKKSTNHCFVLSCISIFFCFFKKIASITSENQPSLQLFSQYGFTLAGTFNDVGYKFGRFLDVTFLQRIITESDVEFTGAASFTPFPWGQYKYSKY